MNNNEKIFELLQKKELSKDEQAQLQLIISSDSEARAFYKTYLNTGVIVKKISHPDIDELADYILVKNGNEPENKEIISRIPSIENHIRNCSECSEEFKLLNAEYSDAEMFVSNEMKSTQKQNSKQEIHKPTQQNRFSFTRYVYISAATVVVIYFGLLLLSSGITPSSQKFASLEKDADYYVTRGRVTTYFQESLKSLEAEDYNSAIANLKSDINENPDDETVFYSHYILGLAYLETAETNFIGLFPSYNKEQAIAGKEALLISIEKNNSGKYPNITLNAYYYAAKASLMINDVNSAKEYLNIVVKEKGSKMNEAQKILNDLE